MRKALIVGALCCSAIWSKPAQAEVSEPAGRPNDQFDFMNLLANRGLHDIHNETWNAYGQFTYISSWKPAYRAAYTNANGSINSLSPDGEHSFTASATVYLGLKLWHGGEAYIAPEVIAERPLSELRGLGGAIQNFELQKTGAETPQLYRSRVFARQTIGLGGKPVVKTSDPMQLASVVDSRRLVFTLGNFSILDFFDKNIFSGDLRRQFFNMAFLTYAAYDFASDARGYSWGGTAELFWDKWAIRFGRISPPKNPNQLSVGLRMDRYYGDQLEIEHNHTIKGQAGAVRILGYRNREFMGSFDDAIGAFEANPNKNAAACGDRFNYGSENSTAPDMCWVRKTNVKIGIGLNLEQHLTEDLGVFFRGMISDGKSEVQAYTSTDRSVSFGALSKGTPWGRPEDLTGAGVGIGWISGSHARYLKMGGVDGFIGDGYLTQGAETVYEVFYSLSVVNAVWISGDFQHIINPAFNADRGPVNIYGARAHAEF